MLLISFSDVIRYYSWYKRALRMAELDGSFTETKGHTNYQIIALCLMLIAFAFLLISYGGSKMSLIALVTIAVIFGITAIVIGLSELMKKLKLSAKANRNATIIITLLLSFGFTGFLLVGVMNQVTALWPDKVPAYTYEYNGFTRAVYDDKLPLTVEDLIEIDYDGYSYELRHADKSVLVEHIVATQRPQLDALENPDLEYTITSVKLPLLYNWCKAALLDNFAHNYGRPVPEDDMWEKHMNIDPQPWGANEVYQLWLGDEPEMRFLLCYDDRIIEIDFEYDWVLTGEQMKTIGEKLNN